MPNDEKIKDKLRKLLELARQGIGGEKDNAQSVLGKLLKKYNLALEDLDPDCAPIEPFEFSFKDELERNLLHQVMHHVLQSSKLLVRVERGNSKKVCIQITRAQKLEIDMAFDIYRKAFKKEQERLFIAFINKNNLRGPGLDEKDKEEDAPAPSDISKEDLMAIAAMMMAIKTTHVYKALPSAVAA